MANLKAPDDIEINATCLSVSVSKGNTESGATGKVQFQLIPESAAELAAHLSFGADDGEPARPVQGRPA